MTKPEGATKLYVVPCSKEKAGEFITALHRHHLPLDFGSYALAVCDPVGRVHGVCVVGRTTTQYIDDGWTLEVRRVCTDGHPNACSSLYAAAWRFVSALGYRKLISYTLPEEGGASLRALGWTRIDNVGGNSWAHRSVRGTDIHPIGKKTRWEISIHESKEPPFNYLNWPTYDTVQKQMSFDSDEQPISGDGVGARIEREKLKQSGLF